MKRISIFAILMLIVASLISCGKDPKPTEEDTKPITFGDYEGMNVVTFDSIDWEYYNEFFNEIYTLSIDLDGDEKPDCDLFINYCSDTTNPVREFIGLSTGVNLDMLSFHREVVLKETFLKTDTIALFQMDDFSAIYIDKKEYCHQVEGSELDIQRIDHLLIGHEKDDILSVNDEYSRGQFYLFQSSRSVTNHYNEWDENNETLIANIIETYTNTSDECWNLPIGEAFYLGFKYSKEGRDRLGWIKFIIEPINDHIYLAQPLETATQK